MRRTLLLCLSLGLAACGGTVGEDGDASEAQESVSAQGLPGTCLSTPNWSCTTQAACDAQCNGGKNLGGGVCNLTTHCCNCY